MSDKKFSDTQLGKTLSRLVPTLTPTVQDKLWLEVKVNHEKLQGCVGPHDFSVQEAPPPRDRWLCTKCGGEVDGINKRWYEKGLAHGRRSVP